MRQLHLQNTFDPRHESALNNKVRAEVLYSHMFLKLKRDGNMKGITVAGVNIQRYFISKEDTSFLTVETEAVLLTCVIDAQEGRYVAIINIPKTLIQTKVEK